MGAWWQLSKQSRSEVLMWGLVTVLLILKIYPGDQSFFVKWFDNADWDEPVRSWYKWLYHHLATLLLFGIVPAAYSALVERVDLKSMGLGPGDWKVGLIATGIAVVLMPIPVYFSSLDPVHRAWYPLTPLATASAGYFALWGLTYLPHYIGWEFFFRGFIGLGMAEKYGKVAATGIQVALTTLLHIGKPMGETVGAAFGGVYLGWLTYRTGSVWWAIIFHFYLGMLNTWLCSI
ncbi:MAG: hypothetical protein Kow0075_16160 [Salibacteraceae bacterium]